MISREEAIRKAEESAEKVNIDELRNNTLVEEVTNNNEEVYDTEPRGSGE